MIKQISSQIVYKNAWMKVREDQIRFPNGTEGIYGVVEKPHFSLIIPYENGGFYLVCQYRYPVSNSYWEFPQGTFEDGQIDANLQALSELKEETGLTPSFIKEIGFLYQGYGFSSQGYHIFIASNFTKGSTSLELSESDLISKWVSEKEFGDMIDRGEIRDASTAAAYSIFLRSRDKLNF